jgi:hypothetical protein
MRIRIQSISALRRLLASIGALGALLVASPALAQSTCTTNFCVQSQSLSAQLPTGWPAVTVAPCCRIDWGSLPSGIDWSKGAPVMLCTGNADYATAYPNCGEPNNLSTPFPLAYDRPKIGIGVAWPNAKDYRYQMQSVPILDGPDGTCKEFSHEPGKVTNWWIYELKDPKRGSYVFTAEVGFQQGDKGYYAVLNRCKLAPPASGTTQ